MKNEFSIIVPTFNEQENIAKTVKTLEEKYPGAEIIIVDDSPDDKTINAVKKTSKKAKTIKNKEPIGLSGSVLAGIKKASFEKIFITDADLQHPLEKMPEMLLLLEKNRKIELVLAERQIPSNINGVRQLSSIVAVSLANLSLFLNRRKTYADPVTGFLCLKKGLMEKIDEKRIVKKGWKISLDLLKQIDGKCVGEVFFSKLEKRKKGISKFGWKPIFYFLISLLN